MLSLRCLHYKHYTSAPYMTVNIRLLTQKKKGPQTPRSLLYRDTSVLTQGSVLSQRDPSKLREFNQQLDDHPEYQDKLLPDMPFKYDDESLIISPTIKNHQRPVPRSMTYNDGTDEYNQDDLLPKLQYFGIQNVRQYQQTQQSLNYSNARIKNTQKQIKPSHPNINIRLQRLFSSEKPTKQPSDDTIQDLLSNNVKIDADDLTMTGDNSPFEAQQKQKELQYQALQMEQDEGEDAEEQEVEEEDHEDDDDFSFAQTLEELDQVPNFKKLFPDDNERDIEIDRFLQKAPTVDKKSVPPDAIILPIYGEIKEYSKMLNIERNILSATLRHLGIYTHNIITQEAAQILVQHLRPNTEVILEQLVDELVSRLPYNKNHCEYYTLSKRKPVLCILGHVDHGKTTLLDFLRHSHVAEHEAGGITQSIGAFSINMIDYAERNAFESHYDEIIVFDTPGHAAFSGMRQRGAHVVDIAILVIDACDGVKPQTKESLAIIRKEKIPFIVAINKIDRIEAEPDKIRKQLSELGVFQTDTEMLEISAKTGEGIGDLLEMVDIVCELQDPRGDGTKNAELVVIEAKKSAAEGTVINALVQDGLLKNGDTVLNLHGFDKDSHAKISRLQDAKGNNIASAGPSTPVSFLGFHKTLPEIGDVLIAAYDEKHAIDVLSMRQTHEYYRNKLKIHARVSSSHPRLHDPTAAMATNYSNVEDLEEDELSVSAKWTATPHTNDPRQLNIWIRADTWGSIEALENYLHQIIIPNEEYYFQIISKDVGPLYENIIRECDSRNCYILNFNVAIKKGQYRSKHVQIFDSNIIFDLFNKFIETLEDKLQPIEQHILCGRAWVKEVFEVKDKEKEKDSTKVAGCIVETGKIKSDGHFRVRRNNKIIYEQWGVSELKHFAINVTEIESGDECGLKLEFDDWKSEDLIECLDIIQEKNKIAPPIFDLDPALQQSLYGGAGGAGGGSSDRYINDTILESRTVFSYADEHEHEDDDQFTDTLHDDYKDENEFVGNHKNTSNAPRVKAAKNKKGRFVFESVDQ